jgi:hypothetical protein
VEVIGKKAERCKRRKNIVSIVHYSLYNQNEGDKIMRLSKVLLFVISLVLVVGIAQAKVNKDGALIIPKTSVVPVIDGKVDAIWNLVDATWLENSFGSQKIDPWSNFAGWAKFLYDDSKIYGLFYVQDDYVDSTSTQDWQMDRIEFYTDVNHTHVSGSQLAAPAYQLNLAPGQPIDSIKNAIKKGLDYKWLLDTASVNNDGPSGYFVEFCYSLDSLGYTTPVSIGDEFSLQFQAGDNDGDGRIHQLNWHISPLNADYQCTSGWGDGVFGDLIDTKYVFLKTTTAPVIDGNLDAIWKDANQITMDYVQPVMAEVTDLDWRFYGLYDDKNIYGLFTVYDNVVDSVSTQDWQMDRVEFYIDVNNTHLSGSQLAAPAYQLNLALAQPIDSIKHATQKGLDYKWALVNQLDGASITNDSIFSSRSGYQLEFKFSLDSLGFTTPPTIGDAFSFQAQAGDNDGEGRIHTSNWWYSPLNADYQCTAGWGDAKFGPLVGTVGVATKSGQVARSFELAQNYPNPFNPSTEISFTLAKSEKVKLAVYNLLGKEVAVLVNGTRNAGPQTVTFNAKNLSSGVYFYKLEAGSSVLAKKMMLLK